MKTINRRRGETDEDFVIRVVNAITANPVYAFADFGGGFLCAMCAPSTGYASAKSAQVAGNARCYNCGATEAA